MVLPSRSQFWRETAEALPRADSAFAIRVGTAHDQGTRGVRRRVVFVGQAAFGPSAQTLTPSPDCGSGLALAGPDFLSQPDQSARVKIDARNKRIHAHHASVRPSRDKLRCAQAQNTLNFSAYKNPTGGRSTCSNLRSSSRSLAQPLSRAAWQLTASARSAVRLLVRSSRMQQTKTWSLVRRLAPSQAAIAMTQACAATAATNRHADALTPRTALRHLTINSRHRSPRSGGVLRSGEGRRGMSICKLVKFGGARNSARGREVSCSRKF